MPISRAAGAAAPHTHDAVAETGPADTPALPQAGFTVRPRPSQTVSADAVLGRSVADLVAQASQRQQTAVSDKRTAPAVASSAAQSDRLAATLSEIERAAQAARRPRVIERVRPQDRTAQTPQPQPQAQPKTPDGPPVTIEVYRAPRVEVWRRRPGANAFDRS